MSLTDFLYNYNSKKIVRPFIIAEAGVNHEGSMDLAKRLIDEAAEGGAGVLRQLLDKPSSFAELALESLQILEPSSFLVPLDSLN
jgi:N-acetylneuraminate synthase